MGAPRSGLPWHSGAWVGGRFSPQTIAAFGEYRGRPADIVTTFSSRASFESMMAEDWPITIWNGFPGRLNYGLALLPDDGAGSLATVAAGQHDDVWRQIARNLAANDRGDSIVRIGWESNLPDWRWQARTDNAEEFKAAYRRVATVMRQTAPELLFEFGIGCGSGLKGSSNRLAPLTELYPGDDVVDVVGCDTYDWYQTQADSASEWSRVLQPPRSPGLEDITEFARLHNKGASFAEWGLAVDNGTNGGGGDNPFYIEAMFNFFTVNSDVLAFECYFDEPDPYIANSIFGTDQNPEASSVYARLW